MVNVLAMKVRKKMSRPEPVKPDLEWMAKMVSVLEKFGEAIEKKQRPEPIVLPDDDVVVEATSVVMAHFERIRLLQNEQDMIAAEIDALKAKIRDRMGDADVLMHDGHTLAYNRAATPTRFDGKAFKAEHPGLYEEFSSTKDPERVFRLAPRRKKS
jgi:hypothetical protein